MKVITHSILAALVILGMGACTQEQNEEANNAMEAAGEEMKQAGENMEKAGEDVAAAASNVANWSADKWNEFVSASQSSFDDMQARWSEIQSNMAEETGETQSELQKKISDGMTALQENIEKMGDASADEWQKLKKENEQLQKDISGWLEEASEKMDGSDSQ